MFFVIFASYTACKLFCIAIHFLTILCTIIYMQANGLDERYNQTLQTMLTKYVQDKKNTWDEYIDTCVFAYNTSKHESTTFTPLN